MARPSFSGILLLVFTLSACGPTELLPPDYRLPDGSTYSGEIRDGLFHGEGVQRAPNGTVYGGEFRDGYWHGEGELDAATGWSYTGEFIKGLMQGHGVLTKDGARYEGQFLAGEFHGPGRFEQEGNGVYAAEFAAGEPVSGTHTLEYGEYAGEFEDWLYHGQGVWTSAGGDRYLGQFVQGQLSGAGEYMGADGEHYAGQFERWQYHGEGVLTEPDGDRMEAGFAYGEPQGEVHYYRSDGSGGVTKLEGKWHNGEFVEAGQQTPGEKRAATAETVLEEDARRLAQSLANLEPERPGVADVYLLAVGGDGSESVFGRDIRVARDGLQAQFDVKGRTLMLLNDRDYATLPLATRPSIRRALQALDERLNPEEDLLAVHLVSHGGPDGSLLLRQPGIALPDLTPDDFAGMLDSLRVQRKLIVVSACFSGHWVNRLKGDHTLVMASAREDRTSFGCGDDSEMTWFTKALYSDENLALHDPEGMFEAVETVIREWETEQGMDAEEWSHPQFFVGEAIQPWLEKTLVEP